MARVTSAPFTPGESCASSRCTTRSCVFIILLPQWRDDTVRPRLGAIVATYQWWFWTYTSNMPLAFPAAFDTPGFPGTHLWTLAIEEQFYLAWPLVVLLFSRRWLIVVCCLLVGGGARISHAGTHGGRR